jgi:hypothetical protein
VEEKLLANAANFVGVAVGMYAILLVIVEGITGQQSKRARAFLMYSVVSFLVGAAISYSYNLGARTPEPIAKELKLGIRVSDRP